MAVTLTPPETRRSFVNSVPFLENGDHLSASEFLRRFERMPEVKKAELIQGIVFMASPVRLAQHGKPDGLLQLWLGTYAAHHPHLTHATNATMKLGRDDVAQPDGLLYDEESDRCYIDHDGYLNGPADLAVEIAASSASVDAREKFATYRRCGVREYLLWRTIDETIEWWTLQGDDYVLLEADEQGLIESAIFPGLKLDVEAALALDSAEVLSALQG